MIFGIDHILIAVEDVDRAMEAYRRLGFRVERGGSHARMGTYNALVPFADGCYLELIGVRDRQLAQQYPHTQLVLQALERETRFVTFALDSTDIDGDVRAIRERGIPMSEPTAGERLRPDTQLISWRTAHPEDANLPFLIQDITPRAMRIAEPTEGIGQGVRLSILHVGSPDVKVRWDAYTKLLDSMSTRRFELSRGVIHLEQADAERVTRLTLRVDDPAILIDHWRARDVPFARQELAGGRMMLMPFDTLGARLEFMV